MRKGLILFLGIGCAICVVAIEQVFGQLPSNSVHRIWDDPTSQVACSSCHLEPDGPRPARATMLWATDDLNGAYSAYSSASLNASTGMLSQTTLLCLSCHDGSSAGMKETLAVGAEGLSNDHPVGVRYNRLLASQDGELHDPSSTQSGLGSTIENDLLENGTMQCVSCHVFHESDASIPNLLRMSNTNSALCMTCHNL